MSHLCLNCEKSEMARGTRDVVASLVILATGIFKPDGLF